MGEMKYVAVGEDVGGHPVYVALVKPPEPVAVPEEEDPRQWAPPDPFYPDGSAFSPPM